MTPLDRSIFLAINHALHSNFNDYWLGYATWLGNGWIGFPIALAILFFLDRSSFGRNSLLLAVAGIVGGIALNVIKQSLHAPRPLTVFGAEIASGHVYVNVMFERLYWDSFPSGHSQTAFTIATVIIWACVRSRKIHLWGGVGIFAVAAMVALSRIYCGAHFPSDILGGAILGAGTAWLCCYGAGRWQAKRLSLMRALL